MPKFFTRKTLKKIRDIRIPFTGELKEVFGEPSNSGIWLIYGEEKHGKTWLALLMADYLAKFRKVLYISAEEGLDGDFLQSIERARVSEHGRRLTFCEYISIEEIEEMISKKAGPKIIIVDNVTVFKDELAYGKAVELNNKYRGKVIFIFLAHEDKGEPYLATAKLLKRLAKVIIRVRGLACHIGGRVPGGVLTIDEEKARLFHGQKLEKSNQP